MKRRRETGGLLLAGCAGLLVLSGCTFAADKYGGSGTESSPSSTTGAAPVASKEAFCRDINSAVNTQASSDPVLTEAQTDDMIKALQSASSEAPADVPPDFMRVVTAMLADLQAPTTSLPASWNTNVTKLAQYAGDYCG